MAYLTAITAMGGVPLFTRNVGLQPLSLATLGLLYGIHTFVAKNGAKLISTVTDSGRMLWKTFDKKILFVLIAENDSAEDIHLDVILRHCCLGMIAILGRDELGTKTEKLRKELRSTFSFVDYLLAKKSVGLQVGAMDYAVLPETTSIQETLNDFSAAVNSRYAFIVVHDCIVAATESWWTLPYEDSSTIALYVQSLPPSNSRDVPVYLPVTSATIPFRLMTFTLVEGVQVCILCGAEPSLNAVLEVIESYWSPLIDLFITAAQLSPRRTVPESVEVDEGISGYLLVDRRYHRSVLSILPRTASSSDAAAAAQERHAAMMQDSEVVGVEDNTSEGVRRERLLAWYRSVAGSTFPGPRLADKPYFWRQVREGQEEPEVDEGGDGDGDGEAPDTGKEGKDEKRESAAVHSGLAHEVYETYMCAEQFKCYALRQDHFQLFVLFDKDVPTFAMRGVAQETMSTLLSPGVLL